MFLPGVAAVVVSYLIYQNLQSNGPEGFRSNRQESSTSYDFIIIGAGSAGSVLANRLTEGGKWRVLILEAGGNAGILSEVPGLAARLQLTNMDWQYKTIPQSGACLAFKNNICNWPRGKVLGGTSVINYMLYIRGNRRDYDQWAAMGNTGWSYDEILPYFIKSEDNRNPYLANTKYHGTGGYLTVQESPFRTPLATAFIEAGVEIGYEIRDGNGAKQTGFMLAQGTIRDNTRCSTAKAFLQPSRNRRNLVISTNSLVHKILIDPTTKQATGVTYERGGVMYNVKATKEVILSAGSVASPQLLMLSGVGPSEHLKSLGIPVISDLRVGDNLQDHITMGGMVFLIDEKVSLVPNRFYNLPTAFNYLINRTTPFSTMGGVEAFGWIKSKYANPVDDWPDIELIFVAGTPASDGGANVRFNHGLKDEVWQKYYQPIAYKDTWQIMPVVLHPLSKGSIRLRSTSPYDKPIIDPKYFSNEQDLKVLIEGIKFVLAVSKTSSMQKFGSRFYSEPFPGCENYTLWTDDYWACFGRHYSQTLYHTTGTCKMGPATDPTAVVDPRLRVYGIKGLRVVDTSIMPNVPGGHTNAPVIMVAEKASDMIKKDWSI